MALEVVESLVDAGRSRDVDSSVITPSVWSFVVAAEGSIESICVGDQGGGGEGGGEKERGEPNIIINDAAVIF